MIWKHETGKKWWLLVLLTMFLLAGAVDMGVAQEGAAILPLKPVPDFLMEELLKSWKIQEGTIHSVSSGAMVISDVTHRLAPNVRYLSEFMGRGESPAEFKAGAYVGYRFNDKREIVEIWLIK